jgi:mannitol-1-phosphate 5-dehydrogenase
MPRTFAGFGFGPIQAGLMIHEALASGAFQAAAIAEVDQALVDAVRKAGDRVSINIAGLGGIRTAELAPCRLYNPRVPADRTALVQAVRDATEIATAVPSVDLYEAGGEASLVSILAEAAKDGKQRIVYTAENNNYAAEILEKKLAARTGGSLPTGLQLLNTVIGKMSGVISSEADMKRLGLVPLVPGWPRCVLVEEFNRILVTRVTLPGFQRGIRVFEEKPDLLPFEEAKLFGHNAVHALLGFLARLRGYDSMSAIRRDTELMALGRTAFRDESGEALIRRHGARGDPLFTPAGFTGYADDLLLRMTNPFLHDSVERIIRDPLRKLAWGDRIFGTMRMALEQGITPRVMSLGAAAGVRFARESGAVPGTEGTRVFLARHWGPEASEPGRQSCIDLVEEAEKTLAGFAPLAG